MASVIRGNDNFDSLLAKFDAGKSLTTNGYQKLSNGLIIQWGNTGVTTLNAQQTITFPIAFTSFSIVTLTESVPTDTYVAASVTIYSQTTTQFKFHSFNAANYSYNWIAIGY